jgi:hypothetical protein
VRSKWFYAHDGKAFGPTTAQTLKQLAASGQLLPSDEVWKEEMRRRVPADKVNGLVFPPLQVIPVTEELKEVVKQDFPTVLKLAQAEDDLSKQRRVPVWLWIAGIPIAGLLLCCGFVGFVGFSRISNISRVDTSQSIPAGQILRDYKKNESDGDQKYKDKVLMMSGRFLRCWSAPQKLVQVL